MLTRESPEPSLFTPAVPYISLNNPQGTLKHGVPTEAWGVPTDGRAGIGVRREPAMSFRGLKPGCRPRGAGRGCPTPHGVSQLPLSKPCRSKSILGGTPGGLEVTLKEGDPGKRLSGGRAWWPLSEPGPPQFSPGEAGTRAPRAPPRQSWGIDASACGKSSAWPPLPGRGVLGEGRSFAGFASLPAAGLMSPASGVVGIDPSSALCSYTNVTMLRAGLRAPGYSQDPGAGGGTRRSV